MTQTSKGASKTDILLEAGTNEFEFLAFQLEGSWYGVNVAKVREVIRWVQPHESPHMHPSVLGMFNLRGQVLSLVDLRRHLGMGQADPNNPNTRIIVTEFNKIRAGFVVDDVEQIHRVSWSLVRDAPDLDGLANVASSHTSSCTGMLELDGRLVLMIDFESIAGSILHFGDNANDEVEKAAEVDRATKRVLVVEDSPFMRDQVAKRLRASGYERAEVLENGLVAWERLTQIYDAGETVDAVVSDIEMPRMDGLTLCKSIKTAAGPMAKVPVVLFSSLISDDNRNKGNQVGADAQIPKPNVEETVRVVDRILAGLPPEAPSLSDAA